MSGLNGVGLLLKDEPSQPWNFSVTYPPSGLKWVGRDALEDSLDSGKVQQKDAFCWEAEDAGEFPGTKWGSTRHTVGYWRYENRKLGGQRNLE